MKTNIRQIQRLFLSAVAVAALSCAAFAGASPDAMRGPALKDVRLEGWLGQKMDRFISRRLVDSFMREQIFDEARQTFEFRDDDEAKDGERDITAKVCDFQSAADARLGDKFTWFTIWF